MLNLAALSIAASNSSAITSSVGTPAGWVRFGPSGFTGSANFDDYSQLGYVTPQSVEFCLREDKAEDAANGENVSVASEANGIVGIIIHYPGGNIARRGQTSKCGNPQTFNIVSEEGEYITQLITAHGKYSFGAKLATNKGRSISIACCGDPGVWNAPAGHGLVAFIGNSGGQGISALGGYWGPNCNTIHKVEGKWVPLTYSSGHQTYSETIGTTSSYTKSSTQTWGSSTTKSVTAGFSFMGLSASTTISHTYSQSLAMSYSQTFSMTKTDTTSIEFDAGQIWQWHFNVTDACGRTDVFGRDWVRTDNQIEEPCCPPGFATDPTKQHGPCAADGLSVCKSVKSS
jgi:hypothetical protein